MSALFVVKLNGSGPPAGSRPGISTLGLGTQTGRPTASARLRTRWTVGTVEATRSRPIGRDRPQEPHQRTPPFPDSSFEGFFDPVRSPDGSLILLGYGLYTKDEVFTYGFATIRPDGTDLHYVNGQGNFEHQPDWVRARGR